MRKYFLTLLLAANCYFIHAQPTTTSCADYSIWNASSFSNNDYFGGDNKSETSDLVHKDLFTGTAQINIPLYSKAINGVDLGVSLTYNTEGILVDRIASDVGLGWELNCGPTIIRQVRDLPDETHLYPYTRLVLDPAYRMPEFVFGKFYGGPVHGGPGNGYWYSYIDPSSFGDEITIDNEPDIFYLQLNGRVIKFMFSHEGDLLTIPETNIRVDRYLQGYLITGNAIPDYPLFFSDPGIYDGSLQFVVTDEAGNKYYFQSVHSTTDYAKTVDKWMPSAIVTFDGHKIIYTYNSPIVRTETGALTQVVQNETSSLISSMNTVWNTYQYQQLAKITYDDGTNVSFQYDVSNRCDVNNSYRLTNVTVSENPKPSGATPVNYSYKFNQVYFSSPNFTTTISPATDETTSEVPITHSCDFLNDTLKLRLKLKSIDRIGFDGVTTQKYYTFNYQPTQLPERIYGGRDCYGYSNGQPPNLFPVGSGMCPDNITAGSGLPYSYCYVPGFFYTNIRGTFLIGMDRSTKMDVRIPSACLLNKITNEKGGSVAFNYATVKSIFGMATEIGGICISSITENDGYNVQNDKNYTYQYNIPAKASASEGSFDNVTAKTQDWSECGGSPVDSTWYFHTNGANLLNTGWGPRYGFEEVIESLYDHSLTILIGSTKTEFTTWTPITSVFGTYMDPAVRPNANKQFTCDWTIGKPWEVTQYDHNSNPLDDIQYLYTYKFQFYGPAYSGFPDKFGGTHKIILYDDATLKWTNDPAVDLYYPNTGFCGVSRKIETKYYNNTSYVAKTTDYVYDDLPTSPSFTANFPMNNLLKETYTNSRGDIITKNYYYNYSWTSGWSVPWVDWLNISGVQELLYTDEWKQSGGINQLIKLTAKGCTVMPSFAGSIIKPSSWYKLATTAPITTPGYTADLYNMRLGVNISNMELVDHVNVFDMMGHPLERNDRTYSKYVASIFDEQAGEVLAKAENAKYKDIAYCGFESDYSATSAYAKGNWNFNPSSISTAHYLLGRCSFHCSDALGTTLNTTGMLTVGQQYTVSFWCLGSGSVFVNDGSPATVATSAVTTYTVPGTSEVWTLYKGTFTAAGTTIGMWGEGYIDEIKLFPANSFMESYNYLPLIGKTTEVDANDNITTYEYDALGNLTVTRDRNGNILTKTKTVEQGH